MRRAHAALLSLILISSPARAEFPAALSAWVGAGTGSGHRDQVRESGPFGLGGLEAAWRFAPGRALVTTYEGAGMLGVMHIPESPHLDELRHVAITLGPEFSSSPGSSVGFFCRGSVGVGRVTSPASRGPHIFAGAPGLTNQTETGFALSGAVGLRLVPRPGPLGFTIALRAAQTFAGHSSCGSMGATFGLTLYPLDRRPAPPPDR